MNPDSPSDAALLQGSNALISAQFERDGAFPDRDGRVTSEAQSYGLLRAVWSDDRPGFERIWRWTEANLVQANGLPAWLWQGGSVQDGSSAADADTDIALALLLAGRRWQAAAFAEAGAAMAGAIWAHEVAEVGGRPYLAAGPWAVQQEQLVINPSYFAPYAYRLFQEADPGHPWLALLDAGYALIARLSGESLAGEAPAGLPPDWAALRREGGGLAPARLGARDSTLYSYDAPRLYWRVAVDYDWSVEARAAAYLRGAELLQRHVQRDGPAAAYGRDGSVQEAPASGVGIAGAYAALRTLDGPLAERLYAEQIVAAAQREGGAVWWGERDDLYRQEWGWFTVALHGRALPSLW